MCETELELRDIQLQKLVFVEIKKTETMILGNPLCFV